MAKKQISNKKKKTEPDIEVDEVLSRSEQFIEKNKKNLIFGIAGIAVLVAIILAYNYMYMQPQSERAEKAIFKGQQYFERDSFALALFGNGFDYDGFESIVRQYGRTKTGNLAKAYAGISYYKLGDPHSAIKNLKSYKGNDDQLMPRVIGLLGDSYVSIGDTKEGIKYFEKAASKANDANISPIYLKKAGIAYESLKQYKDAIRVYTTIKDKYSQSTEAGEIDKYIIRAEQLSQNNN
jgi:tetratricopeptide (TPR) repeat protein